MDGCSHIEITMAINQCHNKMNIIQYIKYIKRKKTSSSTILYFLLNSEIELVVLWWHLVSSPGSVEELMAAWQH